MKIKTLLCITALLLFYSCLNRSKTPVEVLTFRFGDIKTRLGQSGYYITINEKYQVKNDSTIRQSNSYRFYKPGYEFISYGVATLEDKGKTKYESDPFLDDASPIKIIQSVILGKKQDWKIYNAGVLGYCGIISGDMSSLVCSPDLNNIDTLISIASSVSKE
ncbi:hypothetical protein WG954_21405 [Lacibacter sp. H375]|uniref:hypothetical protein n=1 Tax=Lacibacter sp. H375 TaxID=3133424 RepID=UPI0030C40B83